MQIENCRLQNSAILQFAILILQFAIASPCFLRALRASVVKYFFCLASAVNFRRRFGELVAAT